MYRFKLNEPRSAIVMVCLLALSLWGATLHADERILSYHAEIEIQADGSLMVSERIRVQSEARQIQRGIFRDFPTDYRDGRNNRVRVDFQMQEVLKNGQQEPYFLENRSNGIRIYAGSRDRYLEPGIYEYELRYRTTRQLGFFADFDELYWNVTGNGWAFPIDQASARLVLPESVSRDDLEWAFYTGRAGSTSAEAEARIDDPRTVAFQTTRPLAPREGLTVALVWPKGVVTEPDRQQKLAWFFRDNGGALVLLVGWIVVFLWYLWAWNRKGRDPDKGVIIPRYEPPKGLSPAACRYVLDMGFKRESFTAAVVSLGVKGHLLIDEDDGDFVLHRRNESSSRLEPSPGERAVVEALLPPGTDSIELDNDQHKPFGEALAGLKKALKSEYKGRLFNLNGLYALPAVFITLGTAVLAAVLHQENPLIWALWILTILTVHVVFIMLLRAPTIVGRKVMDEIEGFKLYLKTGEQQRLEHMKSPKMTPELFEMFLPFAFALGVENGWTKRFQSEIPRAEREADNYHPAWYNGHLGQASAIHHIGSKLGSDLSGAISSAATPPGSSSGSGGGGFSGGGGGGGGGGGW